MPNVRVHNKTSIINDEKYSMHTLQPHALTRPLHAWFRCMLNIILCIEHGVLYVFWQAKYIQVFASLICMPIKHVIVVFVETPVTT